MSVHFEGGGAMGAAIQHFDWARTSLGPLSTWPVALQTAVGLVLASKFPMCIVWSTELVTIYNDAFTPILGNKPPALGHSFRDVWSEVWDEIGPIAAKAFAGEATYIEDFPLILERRGFAEQTYFTFCYSPIHDESGRVAGMLDTVVETTEKVTAEKTSRVLNRELAHRLQNTMATVSAIAQQTFRQKMTKQEVQTALLERFAALGRAHAVLTGSRWNGASIRAIIESALAPHCTNFERVSIVGPALDLSTKHALALSLAIHELATNALKYGALSVHDGHIDIHWQASPSRDGLFQLRWTERNGPVVKAGERRGFGSRLLEEVLAREFHGHVRLLLLPDGLQCELSTQMRHLHCPKAPSALEGV